MERDPFKTKWKKVELSENLEEAARGRVETEVPKAKTKAEVKTEVPTTKTKAPEVKPTAKNVNEIQKDVSAIQREIAEAGGPQQYLKQKGAPVTELPKGAHPQDPTIERMAAKLKTTEKKVEEAVKPLTKDDIGKYHRENGQFPTKEEIAAAEKAGKVIDKSGKTVAQKAVDGASEVVSEAIEIPSISDGKFSEWFDSLTADELDELWANGYKETIKRRLRSPGGMHEWLLVAEAPRFKRWGVSANEIRSLRTKISEVLFKNPIGKHGGDGSNKAHIELLDIIKSSIDYNMFKRRLNNWAHYRLKLGRDLLPDGLKTWE